jgi:hypothetical protein
VSTCVVVVAVGLTFFNNYTNTYKSVNNNFHCWVR